MWPEKLVDTSDCSKVLGYGEVVDPFFTQRENVGTGRQWVKPLFISPYCKIRHSTVVTIAIRVAHVLEHSRGVWFGCTWASACCEVNQLYGSGCEVRGQSRITKRFMHTDFFRIS